MGERSPGGGGPLNPKGALFSVTTRNSEPFIESIGCALPPNRYSAETLTAWTDWLAHLEVQR